MPPPSATQPGRVAATVFALMVLAFTDRIPWFKVPPPLAFAKAGFTAPLRTVTLERVTWAGEETVITVLTPPPSIIVVAALAPMIFKLMPMVRLADAQTIKTTCTLYPGAAYCTSTATDGGTAAPQARQQQYETGQAIGSGIGMAIYRAHFPGWRRNYCSKHPGQPFNYGNARGDSITGTCQTLNGLANEAAAEFLAKHPGAARSPEHAGAIDENIADHQLPAWESKSYEKALKEAPIPAIGGEASVSVKQPSQPVPAAPQDLLMTHSSFLNLMRFPTGGALMTPKRCANPCT